MQSHDFGRTCRLVESNASSALAASFSSIDEALYAAVEMADRAEEPCLMCGLDTEPPKRWARGTKPMPILMPSPKVEACEPDMIFTTSAALVQHASAPTQRNVIVVALGALLMAVGAHYIFSSLGLRR